MSLAHNSFWVNTFEEHGSSILAFLTSRVGRRDVAEDLLQETFVRVMRHGDRLNDGARIRAYLFTTAHNLVCDQARRRKRRPALFSETNEASSRSWEQVPGNEDPPDSAAAFRMLEERLRQVLETLTADQRAAFEAAVLEQRPYAEIARKQGWSMEKVKTTVFRARRRVIARLEPLLEPRVEKEP